MDLDIGIPLFTVLATPAENAFLAASINSCETQGNMVRLTFRGMTDGPWVDARRDDVTAAELVRGIKVKEESVSTAEMMNGL